METLEAIGQVLWALLLTCGVLVLAYWFTRRVAGRLAVGGKMAGSRMEVLDQMPLGRDQRLVVARDGPDSEPAGRQSRRNHLPAGFDGGRGGGVAGAGTGADPGNRRHAAPVSGGPAPGTGSAQAVRRNDG